MNEEKAKEIGERVKDFLNEELSNEEREELCSIEVNSSPYDIVIEHLDSVVDPSEIQETVVEFHPSELGVDTEEGA